MFHVPSTLLPSLTLFWDSILSLCLSDISQINAMGLLLFALNVVFTFLFWKSADIAWENDRPGQAYLHLFLSAFNGAAVLSAIF